MHTLLRHTFRAMGTECSVVVSAAPSDAGRARRVIGAALTELELSERALSRFDPHSGLSRLNAAPGTWVQVDERLLRAVAAAVAARDATGGRFDPTVLPALIAAGYDRTFEQLRPSDVGEIAGWSAGAAIDIDTRRRRIRLSAGSGVDLGAIGKGLSATAALDAMRASWPSLPGALVDLGGDIALGGLPPDNGGWRVAVEDLRSPSERLGVLVLTCGGVATSGRNRRRLGRDGAGHHLIDPTTGRPALPGPVAVTVIASTTAEAEVHATALAITPVELVGRYLRQHPGLAAIVVPAGGVPLTYGWPPLAEAARATLEAAA